MGPQETCREAGDAQGRLPSPTLLTMAFDIETKTRKRMKEGLEKKMNSRVGCLVKLANSLFVDLAHATKTGICERVRPQLTPS